MWVLLALPGLVQRKMNSFVLGRVRISEEPGSLAPAGKGIPSDHWHKVLI